MAGDLRRKEMFVAKQRLTSFSHGIVKYYSLLSKTVIKWALSFYYTKYIYKIRQSVLYLYKYKR